MITGDSDRMKFSIKVELLTDKATQVEKYKVHLITTMGNSYYINEELDKAMLMATNRIKFIVGQGVR